MQRQGKRSERKQSHAVIVPLGSDTYSKSVFERRTPWSLMYLFLTVPLTTK